MKAIVYAIVQQHNWHAQRISGSGRLQTVKSFRPPPCMAAAESWPYTYVVEQSAELPPPVVWGHATFTDIAGEMTMVADDCDASG